MLKSIFCVLVFALATGCAGKSIREQDLVQIKRVAVYSTLGTKVNHRYVGTTVFQNKEQAFDGAAWKVDEATAKTMRKALRENPSFTKVDLLQGNFGGVEIKAGWQEPLVKQAKAQGFDTLVVIVPASYSNAAAFPPGYGLFRQSALGITHTYAYLLAQVQVFKTATGELAAWHFTYDDIAGKPNLTSSETVAWKENPADFSREERNELQKVLTFHIGNGAIYALHALKLTPAKFHP